jgi:hypothetical protein
VRILCKRVRAACGVAYDCGRMASQEDHPPAREGDRPFADSLCWRCAHHRRVSGARSVFLRCEALPVKYPPQPVTVCPAFRPQPLAP